MPQTNDQVLAYVLADVQYSVSTPHW